MCDSGWKPCSASWRLLRSFLQVQHLLHLQTEHFLSRLLIHLYVCQGRRWGENTFSRHFDVHKLANTSFVLKLRSPVLFDILLV